MTTNIFDTLNDNTKHQMWEEAFDAAGSFDYNTLVTLLDSGMDINHKHYNIITKEYMTLLDYIVQMDWWKQERNRIENKNINKTRLKIIQGLVDRGANIYRNLSEESDFKQFNMGHAIAHKDHELLQILINSPQYVMNQEYRNGDTDLMIAVDGLNHEACKILLDAGANPNCTNKKDDNTTPLHLLALRHYNNTEAIEDGRKIYHLLLQHGADINTTDVTGWSSLQKAAWNYNLFIVQLLINSGCDTSLRNKAGLTALDIAKENKQKIKNAPEIYQLLLSDFEKKDINAIIKSKTNNVKNKL